ncbi:MAG: hypothetical protein JW786_09205 [Desulfobacterales bacterium]|nr:hypothetical protein [Desulfobacterales bacterium]
MPKLGIPVVMDRVVSQNTNLVFLEIFEPDFNRSNYGFLFSWPFLFLSDLGTLDLGKGHHTT